MQGKLKLSGKMPKKSEDQVKTEKVLMQEMIENPDQKEWEYQRKQYEIFKSQIEKQRQKWLRG